MPWQLAAFPRFGTLGNLYLEHFRIDQVVGRHPESTGCYLLDLGGSVGVKAFGILSTLSRIRASSNVVHGFCQDLMCLGGQRAQGHCGAVEP